MICITASTDPVTGSCQESTGQLFAFKMLWWTTNHLKKSKGFGMTLLPFHDSGFTLLRVFQPKEVALLVVSL